MEKRYITLPITRPPKENPIRSIEKAYFGRSSFTFLGEGLGLTHKDEVPTISIRPVVKEYTKENKQEIPEEVEILYWKVEIEAFLFVSMDKLNIFKIGSIGMAPKGTLVITNESTSGITTFESMVATAELAGAISFNQKYSLNVTFVGEVKNVNELRNIF